ncbi:MAG: cysteine--tRNA ligase [Candidatus Methanomethylophilaceae archaeon]
MSLMIHNTLTNSKEEFVTIEPGKVKMYVCGVTVYDDIHMGHARSMIVFDTVARYLRYLGYEVTHVTNFTDVDDKIITRAAKEGIEPLELSKRYIDRYFEDASKLGINRADIYPKASECIPDIINMVQRIIDNGFAYVTSDGSVYFSVDKVEDYGRLTNQKLENMSNQGRQVLNDEEKRNPMDFAVWKAAKPGECFWDSPWGKGRPGWHIECSAMIDKYLGEQIDIHGGGNDLIFPHHENEILQTEAVTGKPLSNYWMHNGMLQVKGHGMSKEEKMSKSLGNFFTVKDVAEKFDTQTIRFYFLNTHYMSPLVYGEDMLEEARNANARLVNNYRELKSYVRNAPEGDADADDCCDLIEGYRQAFRDAMDDDFNTRQAIEVLFQIARATNKAMAEKTLSKKAAERHIALIDEFNGILNIIPQDDGADDETLDNVLNILIDLRGELRKKKMYDLADMIRDRLKESGIALEDSSDGAKWKRI